MVVLGDSISDIAAAANAGWPSDRFSIGSRDSLGSF
jgi:hypothetical protein